MEISLTGAGKAVGAGAAAGALGLLAASATVGGVLAIHDGICLAAPYSAFKHWANSFATNLFDRGDLSYLFFWKSKNPIPLYPTTLWVGQGLPIIYGLGGIGLLTIASALGYSAYKASGYALRALKNDPSPTRGEVLPSLKKA